MIPHSARFRHDTKDVDWLPVVGEKKWIVLMCDVSIGCNALELETLLEAKVKAFVLKDAGLTGPEKAQILIQAVPQMLQMVEEKRFPFIAKIYQDGSVKIWRTDPIVEKGKSGKSHYRPPKKNQSS